MLPARVSFYGLIFYFYNINRCRIKIAYSVLSFKWSFISQKYEWMVIYKLIFSSIFGIWKWGFGEGIWEFGRGFVSLSAYLFSCLFEHSWYRLRELFMKRMKFIWILTYCCSDELLNEKLMLIFVYANFHLSVETVAFV